MRGSPAGSHGLSCLAIRARSVPHRQIGQLGQGDNLLTMHYVGIPVHGQGNGRVPGEGLRDGRVYAAADEVGDERMPQGVEVGVPAIGITIRNSGRLQICLNHAGRIRRHCERQGTKTAMVTVNSDLFLDEIVRDQNLRKYFDVIASSSEYQTTNKEYLWDTVFCQLGAPFAYETGLLIDDTQDWINRFRIRGGEAVHYTCESDFEAWLIDRGPTRSDEPLVPSDSVIRDA